MVDGETIHSAYALADLISEFVFGSTDARTEPDKANELLLNAVTVLRQIAREASNGRA